MKMEILLTPHQWLTIPHLTRLKLSQDFKLSRTGQNLMTTRNGQGILESDGHTVNDLRGINVTSMQEYLGFKDIDPEADFFALLEMTVEKAEYKEPEPAPEAPKPSEVNTQPTPVPDTPTAIPEAPVVAPETTAPPEGTGTAPKPPFCDQCDSKGVRHKAVCPKNVKETT